MSEGGRSRGGGVLAQLVKFAAVGGIGLIVDVGVFNLMLMHHSRSSEWPMIAKTASTLCAIAANWIGSRWWTFRERRRAGAAREALEFLVASLLGSAVALACLAVSHYMLGLTSPLADNVSANVVGLFAGSALRFAAYRWWVFAERPQRAPAQSATTAKVTTTVAPTP